MMNDEEYIRLFVDVFCIRREDIQNKLSSR